MRQGCVGCKPRSTIRMGTLRAHAEHVRQMTTGPAASIAPDQEIVALRRGPQHIFQNEGLQACCGGASLLGAVKGTASPVHKRLTLLAVIQAWRSERQQVPPAGRPRCLLERRGPRSSLQDLEL